MLHYTVVNYFQANKGTTETHLYKKLYPWEDAKELAEHLKNTEVCNIGKFL